MLLALTFSACSARTSGAIKKQAAADLQCSEGQVHVSAINKRQGQYLAEACQRRAVYSYTKQNGVVRLSEVEGPAATPAPVGGQPVVMMPPATTDSTTQPPPPPPPPPPTP
ncbi:MAG: hypothetical protein QM817_18595 [Archangium sp.]